jgi:hypothetical protein
MIQAFIALIIIASSLTYSVNAAAIAPARQFLFLGLVDREDLLLTSNSGFARDRLPGSPVTARFNEKRQDLSGEDEDLLDGCGANDDDFDCLLNQESLLECRDTVARTGDSLADCLSALCPDTDSDVIDCVSDPVAFASGPPT